MSKENIPQERIDEWNKQLEYCMENDSRLQDWEREHVDGYSKHLSDYGYLTWRQSKTLRQIYNRI